MTCNLPDKLTKVVRQAARELRYEGLSEYCVALMIWDIYSRQRHEVTGPVMRGTQWMVDNHVDDLLARIGVADPRRNVGTHRFTVRVPKELYPAAIARKDEERYRSDSAYIVSLVLYALDPAIPEGKGVPHHKLSPLMREPRWIRNGVFARIAEDFGNPDRTWPHGIAGRIGELVAEQQQLKLPLNRKTPT